MKKKVILLLLLLFGCLFSVKNVYADTEGFNYLEHTEFINTTGINLSDFYPNGQPIGDLKVGDKRYIGLHMTGDFDSSVKFVLRFKSLTDNSFAETYLEDFSSTSDKTFHNATYTINSDFKKGHEYKFYSLTIQVIDKENSIISTAPSMANSINYFCDYFVFYEEDMAAENDKHPTLAPQKFGKTFKILQKDGPDILKSFSLNGSNRKFYIGDKISFNVETTQDFGSMNVTFYNSTSIDGHSYGMFTVYLTADGPKNGNVRTYSGYIPKTIDGYYASADTGRTQMTIYPGNYSVNSIFFYGVNGQQYVRYTVLKDFAESGEYLYYDPKITIDLKEPTADELNDVNFVIESFKLNSNKVAIGETVSLNAKYTYDNTSKKVKSMYLVFKNPNRAQQFTTYVKGLPNNPSFAIPSSADSATYVLNSIGVTFEATDGTNNTVIFDANTSSGKYKEIFNQQLTVDASNGNMINGRALFSTEELSEEVYKTIQESSEKDITIDADNETIIPLELFKVIKESNKNLIIKYQGNELRFNGEDIKSPRDIDVLMKLYNIDNSNISDTFKKVLNGDAVVVEFSNNGDLPGSALFRLKESDVTNSLKTDKYYVYYANDEKGTLDKVALDVQKTSDGYIEFYMNHHSKYVITTQEIKDEEVLGEDDEVLVSNEELVVSKKKTTKVAEEKKDSKKSTLVFVLIGALVVLVIVLVIVVVNKGKKKAVVDDKPIESKPLEEEITPEENTTDVENTSEEENKEE